MLHTTTRNSKAPAHPATPIQISIWIWIRRLNFRKPLVETDESNEAVGLMGGGEDELKEGSFADRGCRDSGGDLSRRCCALSLTLCGYGVVSSLLR